MGRQGVEVTGASGIVQRVHRRCCVIMGSRRSIVWSVVGVRVLMLKEGARGTALCAYPVLPVLTRKGDTRAAASSVDRGDIYVLILNARGRTRVFCVTHQCAVSMWRSAVRVWVCLPVFTMTRRRTFVFAVRLIWRAKHIPQSMYGTAVRTTGGR